MKIALLPLCQCPGTQFFGEHAIDYSKYGFPGHNGIDYGCPEGTPIKAAADGVIEKIGNEPGGYGNYIKIRHAPGVWTYYAHLLRATPVGNKVFAGEVIGLSGNTGASTGPHLHFGLRLGTTGEYKGYVNPAPYFESIIIELPAAIQYPEPQAFVIPLIARWKLRSDWDYLTIRSAPSKASAADGRMQPSDEFDGIAIAPGEGGIWAQASDKSWRAVWHAGNWYLETVKE